MRTRRAIAIIAGIVVATAVVAGLLGPVVACVAAGVLLLACRKALFGRGKNAQADAVPLAASKSDADQSESLRTEEELPPVPEPMPSADEESHEDEQAQEPDPGFDFHALLRSVIFSSAPIERLREFAEDTKARLEANPDSVCGVERFLAHGLAEADVAEYEEELAQVQVIRTPHSRLLYLRTSDHISYGAYVSVLKIEARLNAALLADRHFDDLEHVSEEDLLKFWQRTSSAVASLAPIVDTADWSYLAMPWQTPFGPSEQGEWAVRQELAEAIESSQVPYRLVAHFRCNVSGGDVALEFEATPERAFPGSAFVDGLGVVATTADMRRREASKYAARIGFLLAAHAFHASPRIRRVWVAGIRTTPTRHEYLYSACFERRSFIRTRYASTSDPVQVLRSLGARMNELGGVMLPAEPLFYLEDERFCPRLRHDLWELSERPLPAGSTRALGTTRVSGLNIHEELPRSVAAQDMLEGSRRLDPAASTHHNVRTILSVAHATSDLSVWSAAEHVAGQLVDGTMEIDDPDLFLQEFVSGDTLSKSVDKAQRLLMDRDPVRALGTLQAVLDPLDAAGHYNDTGAVAYRCFQSFAERVLYQRLNTDDKRSVVLVPEAYLNAHLMLAGIRLALPQEEGGSTQAALEHAQRALQLAPLDAQAHLGVVACLRELNYTSAAIQQLNDFLEVAYHPHAIGIAYHQLASALIQEGRRDEGLASYHRCVRLFPPLLPFVMAECQALLMNEGDGSEMQIMEPDEADRILREGGTPLAPTPRIAYLLFEGAAAAVDAEVFPVARDIMHYLVSFTGDDVLRDILDSLEREPDV